MYPVSQSVIGVGVAIGGNMFISIALNIQKYVHNSIAVVKPTNLESELEMEPKSHEYLKSKLWWLGLAVMILGELGNFAAYGFAPAVLVAPLGTVALISNIIFAPLVLGEQIRKQDVLGIFVSIIGTGIILAVSTSTAEPTLSVDDIINAITQLSFVLYFMATMTILSGLLVYSKSPAGKKFILIDLSIASIIGGYTVLSIKALSSLLKLEFYRMFTHWITYVMGFVLIATCVLQIHFLNRSLSSFNSVEVVPTNFVLFTTWSIVGSSVLYHDMARTSPIALLGVAFMFYGVYLITSKSEEAILPFEAESLLTPTRFAQPINCRREDLLVDSAVSSMTETISPIMITNSSPRIDYNSLVRSPNQPSSFPSRRLSVASSFGEDLKTTHPLKRISMVFDNVGTHAIRRMELDHMAEHTLQPIGRNVVTPHS